MTNDKTGTLARSEPLLTVAGITAAIAATISLAVAFGFDMTPEQKESILVLTAIVSPILVGLFARSKVYSPDSVARLEDDALVAAGVLAPDDGGDPASGTQMVDDLMEVEVDVDTDVDTDVDLLPVE